MLLTASIAMIVSTARAFTIKGCSGIDSTSSPPSTKSSVVSFAEGYGRVDVFKP
jgi:hypothetical protein